MRARYPRRRADSYAGAPSADADAEVLDLGVVEDPVLGALPSHARLLDATERGHLGGDDPGVEADDAVLERLADPPGAGEVARVEVGGETELGVVRHAHGVGLALEAKERRHRAEGLLPRHEHLGRDVGE